MHPRFVANLLLVMWETLGFVIETIHIGVWNRVYYS